MTNLDHGANKRAVVSSIVSPPTRPPSRIAAGLGDPGAFYANTAELTVPAQHVFVAGDNRANAADSRMRRHGTVPVANLVARVTDILMSVDMARLGLWIGSPR